MRGAFTRTRPGPIVSRWTRSEHNLLIDGSGPASSRSRVRRRLEGGGGGGGGGWWF